MSEAAIARINHTGVWTGSELLVFGGKSKRLSNYFQGVVAFNPETKSWRNYANASSPEERHLHSAVWTGSSMIVFGGEPDRGDKINSGGVFFP